MAPLVRPVVSVRSDIDVPAYPLRLNTGAVFSTINSRVRSAFPIYKYNKLYRWVYWSNVIFVDQVILVVDVEKVVLVAMVRLIVLVKCFNHFNQYDNYNL